MRLKKILFPFSSHKEVLQSRWWHRLFVVLFSINIIVGVLLGILATVVWVNNVHHSYNSIIITTLNDYAGNQDPKIANVTPQFIKNFSYIGCLEDDGEITYVSTTGLEYEAFCSADIRGNLSSIADQMMGIRGLKDKASLVSGLEKILNEDDEHRKCFISNKICSSSRKIVAYKPNAIFYAVGALVSLVVLYIFSLLLQLTYYKAVIYIIYGKDEKNLSKHQSKEV